MSQYKKVMQTKGIQQKEVLDAVHHVDPRVDKSLLSKIVNDVCLPTPRQFKAICDTLVCDVSDIYDPREIALAPAPEQAAAPTQNSTPTTNQNTERTRARRQNLDVYNLTVEIPRDIAERVFAPAALRKLGYLNKSDLVRHLIFGVDARLAKIIEKQKTADGAGTPPTGHNTTT